MGNPTDIETVDKFLAGAETATDYSTMILANTPLRYYRLNESVGSQITDSSGNDIHGVYNGSPDLAVPGAIDQNDGSNTAVFFDGTTGEYGECPASAVPTTGSWTIEAWFRQNAVAGEGAYLYLGSDGFGAGWGVGISLTSANFNFSVVLTSPGTVASHINIPNPFDTNGIFDPLRWYHCVCVFIEGDGIYAYINGYRAAYIANTNTNVRTSTVGLLLGAGNAITEHEGYLDEIATYNYALPEADIVEHYQKGQNGYPTSSPTGIIEVELTLH